MLDDDAKALDCCTEILSLSIAGRSRANKNLRSGRSLGTSRRFLHALRACLPVTGQLLRVRPMMVKNT